MSKLRPDSLGLFWRDEPPPPKIKKEVIKRTPPEPVWLNRSYLPHYEEAANFKYDFYTDQELIRASIAGERLDYDIETYENYTLIMFMGHSTEKIVALEMIDGVCNIDLAKLRWMMLNFVTVGFNSNAFDNTITTLILAGKCCMDILSAANMMIQQKLRPYDVLKAFEVSPKKLNLPSKFNHIDLMLVAPRKASLKKYSGRLQIERIQDLPFPPGMFLDREHIVITRWYCCNDLKSTYLLHNRLMPRIDLRIKMGQTYNLDLRCKSDPQIAEAIFVSEAKRLTGKNYLPKPKLENYLGRTFRYQVPQYVQFYSPTMQSILNIVRDELFYIVSNEETKGKVSCANLIGLTFEIGTTLYKMGIGGLHGSVTKSYFKSENGYKLRDHDVTSYYPELILNLGMFPEAIGSIFLQIYGSIKKERVNAKRGQKEASIAGNISLKEQMEVINESLKIVINGSFGKFGDPYSYLYAPNLLVQTTLTGQLSLLMLIERLELAGIKVLQANTDGIVTYNHETLDPLLNEIIKQWELETKLELEHVLYNGLFVRDVNAYFAIKEDGSVKGKGVFSLSSLEIDPKNEICAQAVMDYFAKRKPIEQTIHESNDITKFVQLCNVKGGAVKDGEYLGEVVRFYKSNSVTGEIVYAKTGNKVPKSDSCKPIMKLPISFPNDVDKEAYIKESLKLLEAVGY